MKRAGDRVVAAVPAQPSGFGPEMPDLSYQNNMKGGGAQPRLGTGWGPDLCARRPDITMAMVDTFLTNAPYYSSISQPSSVRFYTSFVYCTSS